METLDQNLTLNHLLDQAENLPHALIVPALGLAETVDQAELRNRLRSLPYKQFLKTRYWRAVALAVKDRAGQRCQCCNSTLFLQAHHRTYDHHGEEHRFMIDLTCMCDVCHDKFHGTAPAQSKVIVKRDRSYRGPIPKRLTPMTAEQIEALMPAGTGPIVLTEPLISHCRTRGGFTNAAVRALGVTSLKRGWPKRLIGQVVTREQFRTALIGRALYAKPRTARFTSIS